MKPIGEVEFMQRWRAQHDEWLQISNELVTEAKSDGLEPPTAWEVSHELRERAIAQGRTLVTVEDGAFYEITPDEDRRIAERANA